MLQYNFAAFIEKVKDLPFKEMLRVTEETFARAENQSKGKRGIRARQQGSLTFVEEVGEFLFFLQIGVKPSSVSELNWLLYRKPVENLIQKGQMKPSALSLFK